MWDGWTCLGCPQGRGLAQAQTPLKPLPSWWDEACLGLLSTAAQPPENPRAPSHGVLSLASPPREKRCVNRGSRGTSGPESATRVSATALSGDGVARVGREPGLGPWVGLARGPRKVLRVGSQKAPIPPGHSSGEAGPPSTLRLTLGPRPPGRHGTGVYLLPLLGPQVTCWAWHRKGTAVGMGSRQRVPGRAVQPWEPCVVMEPMGVGTPPFILQLPPKWRAPGPAYGGCIWHGKGLCESPGRRAV